MNSGAPLHYKGCIPAVRIPLLEVNSGASLHYKGCIRAVRIPLPEVNSGAPLHYKGCIPAVWIPLPEANSGGSLHYKGFMTAVWISLLELNGALKFPGKGVALSIYPLFHQTGSKSFLGVWSLLKKKKTCLKWHIAHRGWINGATPFYKRFFSGNLLTVEIHHKRKIYSI